MIDIFENKKKLFTNTQSCTNVIFKFKHKGHVNLQVLVNRTIFLLNNIDKMFLF
jgi:hypothetical protein